MQTQLLYEDNLQKYQILKTFKLALCLSNKEIRSDMLLLLLMLPKTNTIKKYSCLHKVTCQRRKIKSKSTNKIRN